MCGGRSRATSLVQLYVSKQSRDGALPGFDRGGKNAQRSPAERGVEARHALAGGLGSILRVRHKPTKFSAVTFSLLTELCRRRRLGEDRLSFLAR